MAAGVRTTADLSRSYFTVCSFYVLSEVASTAPRHAALRDVWMLTCWMLRPSAPADSSPAPRETLNTMMVDVSFLIELYDRGPTSLTVRS